MKKFLINFVFLASMFFSFPAVYAGRGGSSFDQQQDRIMALQQSVYQQGTNTTTVVLIIALLILFFSVAGLAFMLFRMQNKKE